MAQMAAPMLIAAGVQAVGSIVGGLSEQKALNRDAAISEENARLNMLTGEREALNVYREERQQVGASLAAASGGIGGSIGLLVQESARQAEMEVERVREAAFREAQNNKERARAQRSAGRQAAIGGIFNAVTTALGQAASMRTQNSRFAINERQRAFDRKFG